jgi:hypothetical protein
MVTAVITNEKFLEPSRSEVSARASLIGRPSFVSVMTRPSSLLAGSWPSSTTVWIPCMKLWPALSEAASVTSRSGSWSSKALIRLRALNHTQPYGSSAPTANATSRTNVDCAVTAAKIPSTKALPIIR